MSIAIRPDASSLLIHLRSKLTSSVFWHLAARRVEAVDGLRKETLTSCSTLPPLQMEVTGRGAAAGHLVNKLELQGSALEGRADMWPKKVTEF